MKNTNLISTSIIDNLYKLEMQHRKYQHTMLRYAKWETIILHWKNWSKTMDDYDFNNMGIWKRETERLICNIKEKNEA